AVRAPGRLLDHGLPGQPVIAQAIPPYGARRLGGARSPPPHGQGHHQTNHGLSKRILSLTDDAPSHEVGLRAILISRCLERIGDNAVDIGEQTAYLVTAQFREFTDASRATPA